ncbi:uncharacterized protein LOC134201851 [Bombyx mori]|uniref:uncharacterized protein LOC134201851 n=1 Tax=Bombyx mori TaxID=7091 RepID=UPI002ED0CAE1
MKTALEWVLRLITSECLTVMISQIRLLLCCCILMVAAKSTETEETGDLETLLDIIPSDDSSSESEAKSRAKMDEKHYKKSLQKQLSQEDQDRVDFFSDLLKNVKKLNAKDIPAAFGAN